MNNNTDKIWNNYITKTILYKLNDITKWSRTKSYSAELWNEQNGNSVIIRMTTGIENSLSGSSSEYVNNSDGGGNEEAGYTRGKRKWRNARQRNETEK